MFGCRNKNSRQSLTDAALCIKFPMRKSLPLILLLMCGLLLGYNVALQRRVTLLTKENRDLVSSQAPAIGSFIRRVQGHDLSNQEISIDFSSQPKQTLLLVFSPMCRFCAENWPNWQKLLQSAPGANVVFADTSGEADLGYLQKVGISPPVQVVRIGTQTKLSYKLSTTPTTVLLGSGGRVEEAWVGVLSGDELDMARRKLAQN